MPDSKTHLSDWTLEQHAEGMLPEYERLSAEAHLESCARCASEFSSCRSLFAALAELPRFAPSPGFGDVVISRIRIGPAPNPALEQLRRWLPATRRGWTLLAAALVTPALPLVALLVWLLSRPMVSTVSLMQWGTQWGSQASASALSTVTRWETAIGLDRVIAVVQTAISGLPLVVVVGVVLVFAVGIPLSAWSLIRLVRTPMGDVHYAN